jgi:hypothetical protein
MSYRARDLGYYSHQRSLESLTYRMGELERDLQELQTLVIDLQDLVQHLLVEADK